MCCQVQQLAERHHFCKATCGHPTKWAKIPANSSSGASKGGCQQPCKGGRGPPLLCVGCPPREGIVAKTTRFTTFAGWPQATPQRGGACTPTPTRCRLLPFFKITFVFILFLLFIFKIHLTTIQVFSNMFMSGFIFQFFILYFYLILNVLNGHISQFY